MLTSALVLATSQKFVWLKLPDVWPHKILIMPRSTLPRGMGTAEEVLVDLDPDSLYCTDVHYRANLEVVSAIRRRGDGPSDHEEGPGQTTQARRPQRSAKAKSRQT